MPSKAAPHTQAYILICGYAAVFLAFLGAGFSHLRGTMAAQADIDRCNRDIEMRSNQAQELQSINSQIDLIRAQTKDYTRLISTEDPALFVREISRQLAETGVRDPVFQGMQRAPLVHSEKFPIEIHCRCTYAQLRDFLKRLESLPRLSAVGRLQIEADTEMAGTIDVQLTLFVYNVKSSS